MLIGLRLAKFAPELHTEKSVFQSELQRTSCLRDQQSLQFLFTRKHPTQEYEHKRSLFFLNLIE